MARLTSNLGKSHYEAVAAALRAELDNAGATYRDHDGEAYRAHVYALRCTMQRLIMVYMGADAPSRLPFDPVRFRAACGFPDSGPSA